MAEDGGKVDNVVNKHGVNSPFSPRVLPLRANKNRHVRNSMVILTSMTTSFVYMVLISLSVNKNDGH